MSLRQRTLPFGVAFVCILCAGICTTSPLKAQVSATRGDVKPSMKEEVALVSACSAFEKARASLDIEGIKRHVLPTARGFLDDGKLDVLLLKEFESKAKKKKKDQPATQSRVLHRQIEIVGPSREVAHVVELLGAPLRVDAGTKIKPYRRSTTWAKLPTKGMEWKVAAMHESPYSVWEKAITAYEAKDKTSRYEAGSIVFIGSSSIRGWKTLSDDFPGLPVLGRGFGGSQMIDSIMYAHRIVLPYQPSAVAVYAGDNDIGKGKSAEKVFHDFKTFVATLHATDPKIRIGFIAIKPSLKRWSLWTEMDKANQLIANFAKSNESVTYLDIATPMLGADGKPRPELFVKDGLHMTRRGYEVWSEVVLPWAKK